MVNVAKWVLIIGGLFLAFIIRVRSRWLFTLSLIVILFIGIIVLAGHKGAALQFSVASFFLLLMALIRYLVEIKKNEK